MKLAEIKSILPHREPFLFVDEVTELTADRIRGKHYVDPAEFYFAGHFPEFPIVPGVIVVEALAQVGGILYNTRRPRKPHEVPVFLGIEKTRFRKPVRPGDTLLLEAVLTAMRGVVAKLSCQAKVEDEVVCTAELIAGLAPRDSL